MSSNRRKFLSNAALGIGAASFGFPVFSKQVLQSKLNGNKLVLLGTKGGPGVHSYVPSPAANLIVYNNIPFVIDTGYGVTFKLLEAGIKLSDLKYIFITHHHSDHNLELGTLLYNSWIGGLRESVDVFAPTGVKSMLEHYWLSNQFDIETRINDEGRAERIDIRKLTNPHEYTEGELNNDNGIIVTAMRNIHPPIKESYALKFKLGDKTIVFSGDTNYYPALAEFSFAADYLIHEVMLIPAVERFVKRRANAPKNLKESIIAHHTSAEDVGRIASQAKVKNLVLNHFVPSDDKSLTDQDWIDAVRTTFDGNIIVGKDLLELPL
ncbi:MAG: MBL fold metallo-hydrolase [Ignavibacteriales bacterium]|nr:MAG: MBL fold metallo-hydrolase [Ignavibacteriales bacterium]